MSLGAGFDENPRLQSDQRTEALQMEGLPEAPKDVSYAVVGADFLVSSTTETELLAAFLGISASKYDESELDSELVEVGFDYEKTGLRNDIGMSIALTSTSDFQSELLETGVTTLDSTQEELSISPTYTVRFSEEWTGTFAYSFSDISYSGSSTAFVDSVEHTVSLDLAQEISERLSLLYSAGYSQYRPDRTELTLVEDDNTARILFGLNYRFSEPLSVRASAGSTNRDSTEGDDFSYIAELIYIGLRNNLNLRFSIDQEVSPLGGISESNRFAVAWGREQTFGGNLSMELSYLDREGNDLTRGLDSFALTPSLEYELGRNDTLVFQYQYIDQELLPIPSAEEPGIEETASTNRVLITWNHNFSRKKLGE